MAKINIALTHLSWLLIILNESVSYPLILFGGDYMDENFFIPATELKDWTTTYGSELNRARLMVADQQYSPDDINQLLPWTGTRNNKEIA